MSAGTDSGAGLRALAARLNDEVVFGGRSLASLEGRDRDLPERDRSLLRAMLNESLRWHMRYEWLLGRLLDRPLKRRDHGLAALLRIGLTQIDALRIPDHAAVSATVAATAALGLGHARRLTNAVLRRYLREREALGRQLNDEDVPRYSHPDWLIAALRQDWPDRWQAILEAGNEPPPMWLRVNRRRTSRDAFLGELERAGLSGQAGETGPDAVLLSEPCPVASLPGFADGHVSVQDAGAQYAARLLEAGPGMRVLDACAAPGGKSGHILESCPALDELVCLDNDAARIDLVSRNLDRLGAHATLITADARDTGEWFSGQAFDRILLDAPCSATGVIRRHPDIKVLRRASDIEPFARQQGELLRALWPLLRPGGRMLYVTCSVLERENRQVVEPFVEATADAALEPFGSACHFQLLPGDANCDGFYYACLTRAAGSDN